MSALSSVSSKVISLLIPINTLVFDINHARLSIFGHKSLCSSYRKNFFIIIVFFF